MSPGPGRGRHGRRYITRRFIAVSRRMPACKGAAAMTTMGWSGWWRQVRRAAVAVGVTAGGALIGGAGVGYYVANELTKPARPTPSDDYVISPFETGADFEEITFPSERSGRQ